MTDRQREYLKAIRKLTLKLNRPPTIAELGKELKVSSVATVHDMKRRLIRIGYIQDNYYGVGIRLNGVGVDELIRQLEQKYPGENLIKLLKLQLWM